MDVTGLLEEVSILAHLRHPHVTAFVDFVEDAWYYYVVLELVRGGELFDRISKKVRFWIRARLGLFVSWSFSLLQGPDHVSTPWSTDDVHGAGGAQPLQDLGRDDWVPALLQRRAPGHQGACLRYGMGVMMDWVGPPSC